MPSAAVVTETSTHMIQLVHHIAQRPTGAFVPQLAPGHTLLLFAMPCYAAATADVPIQNAIEVVELTLSMGLK